MIACVDVAFVEHSHPMSVAACLVFENWKSDSEFEQHIAIIDQVEAYVPGLFY